MNGFVNIMKPMGMTSNDVVVKVRGILRSVTGAREKVGHLGTLDPLAEGVLPIAIGRATKLFDLFLSKQKTYVATFRFGVQTDTLDSAGKPIVTSDKPVCAKDLEEVLRDFIGEIEQLPPAYSAKSVGGKRAYALAREGKPVELAPKRVQVYSIELFGATDVDNEYQVVVTCGAGTYIRSLARDVANALGTVGYMSSLRRICSGQFDISDSVPLDKFAEDPARYILPISYPFAASPRYEVTDEELRLLVNGVPVPYDAGRAQDKYAASRTQSENDVADPLIVSYLGDPIAIGEVVDDMLRLSIRLFDKIDIFSEKI